MKEMRKTEGLISLEKSIEQSPHRYFVSRFEDGSLHKAEHLDSGTLWVVSRNGFDRDGTPIAGLIMIP